MNIPTVKDKEEEVPVPTYSDKIRELEESVKNITIDHGPGNEQESIPYVPLSLVVDLLPVGKAERKVVMAQAITSKLAADIEGFLDKGWVFDPWLSPRGHPTILGEKVGCYWVLVKGTPEEIAKLEPFVELPKEEVEEEEIPGPQPVGYATIFLEHTSEAPDVPDGYAILHDKHIFAKGTVYTKISKEEPSTA